MQQGKPSKVEEMKRVSHRLRGTIGPVIASSDPIFGEADKQLLKFHGVYQGYDRDSATELKQKGEAKHFEFMIRVKMPGGILTAAQYLELDRIAQRYAGGKLRITTRQAIQFHAVIKDNLWATIHEVNESLLTTMGACGDVVRNVTATAAPFEDDRHRALRTEAARLSRDLAPKTKAYHEIWVGETKVEGLDSPTEEPEVDPLYGPTYLPRKFKIGLAMPENNDVDVLTNDAALVAIFDGQRLLGYNLAIGGGQGMTHNRAATYPRLASYVGFVPPEGVLDALKAVIALQRDNGDRSDRRHARLKYVVDAMGLDWIIADLEQRLGHPLEKPRPMNSFAIPDLSGWHEQGDGRFFFGLPIPSGRIADFPDQRWASAFRRIFTEISCRPVMAPSQDIYFADVAAADKARLEAVLTEEGVPLPGKDLPIRRWALACPALPTCGLALNEAERVLSDVVGDIETVLERHHLSNERISFRMTGCPNGCARSYTGDIGLVGRTPDTYAIYLGGDFEGTRLNTRVFERVPLADLGATLDPIFASFAAEREPSESFGDFCQRKGPNELVRLSEDAGAVAAE